jgi:hypothetical protein
MPKAISRLMQAVVAIAVTASAAQASSGVRRVCYQRVYDAAHLAQHPQQLVTQIGILVSFNDAEGDEAPFPYTVYAKVRGQKDLLHNSGACGFREEDGLEVNGAGPEELTGKKTMSCSSDGDLGGVMVKRVGNGQKALLQLEPMKHIMLIGDCGNDSCTYDLKPGADDKSFLADRMPDAFCSGMEKAKK